MKKNTNRTLALILLTLGTWSCNKKEKDPEPQPYRSGVLVINAGNFLDNNGTLSFLTRNERTVNVDIFNQVNQRSLTGSVSHYTEIDGKGLILVDNSTANQDKIEIVDANTFKSLTTIKSPDIENPRYVIRVGTNKAYVSCWDLSGDFSNGTFFKDPGYIAVIDLTTNTVVKKIPTIKGPETLQVVGNEVFVGSAGDVKTLAIIDIEADKVKQLIEIGNNPTIVGVDANGKLWVASGSEAIRLNPQMKTIETRIKIGSKPNHLPSLFRLSPDRQNIYFVYSYYDGAQKGKTYKFSIYDTTIQTETPFINRLFNGLEIDPQTGIIYGGYTPSFKQAGYVYRFQSIGTLIDSVKVEVNPSGFYFK